MRKAVLAGFNRQATLMALGGKRVGTVATHFLPPGMPGFEQAGGTKGTGADFLATPAGDAAVAAEYMKAAGFASGRYEGEPILMVGPTDGNGRAISEIAKAAFESVGFKVKLRLLSQQVVMTRYCGYPAAAVAVCPNVGWTRDFADGQTFLDPTFNGENIQPVGNANVSQLDDPAVNAAIERAKTMTDPSTRAAGLGRGRPRDHGARAGRAARVGQGPDGALGGRRRRRRTRTSASGTSPSRRFVSNAATSL